MPASLLHCVVPIVQARAGITERPEAGASAPSHRKWCCRRLWCPSSHSVSFNEHDQSLSSRAALLQACKRPRAPSADSRGVPSRCHRRIAHGECDCRCQAMPRWCCPWPRPAAAAAACRRHRAPQPLPPPSFPPGSLARPPAMESDAGPAFDFSHLPTDALHVVFEHVFAPADPQQQPALPLSVFFERWAACSAVCKTWREVRAACACAGMTRCRGVGSTACFVLLSAPLVSGPKLGRSCCDQNATPTRCTYGHCGCCAQLSAGAAGAPATCPPRHLCPAPRLAALAVVPAAAHAVHPGGRRCGEQGAVVVGTLHVHAYML